MAGIEILGALAGAVQLADICIRVAESLSTLLLRVADVPISLSTQKAHLAQLVQIMRLIQCCPSLQTPVVASILTSLISEVKALQGIVLKASAGATAGKAKTYWKSLETVLKGQRIASVCARLEKEKNSLTLCIATIDSELLHSLNLEVVKIQCRVDSVFKELSVIRDTAQGVTCVLEDMPKLTSQIRDLHSGIPDIANNVMTVKDDIPIVARKIDFISDEIPLLRKTVERVESQQRAFLLPYDVEERAIDLQSQSCSRAVEELERRIPGTNGKLPTEPIFNNLPSSRITDFVGRKDLLQAMDVAFSRFDSIVNIAVLTGMGGSGKTQLAMMYCHLQFMQHESIFWANASTEDSLRQSFGVIAEVISKKLRTTYFPDLDSRIRYVKEALGSSLKHWLLVFDNYDSPSQFESIRSFIPSAAHGAIIITSRHPESARLGSNIKVAGMHEAEALDLLLRRTESELTEANVKNGELVVSRLGYLPLAIDQAGSYIRKQKVSLSEFIGHYNQRRERVLQYTPQLWEYRRWLGDEEGESRLSVFTTWELSFQQLRSCHRLKEIELVTLFGFFHYASISEELFQAYHERLEATRDRRCPNDEPVPSELSHRPTGKPKWMTLLVDEKNKWDTFNLRETIAELHEMFLVQDFASGDNEHCKFSLHPLVSDWIRLRDKDSRTRQNYTRQAIHVVTSFLDSRFFSHASLQTKQEILAHMDESLANDKNFLDQNERLGSGSLSYSALSFGKFYHEQGRYSFAEALYKRVLKTYEDRLGCDHPETLQIVASLGNVYHSQGWHSQAEALYDRVLKGQETHLGWNHLDTLRTVEDLANIYRSQGRYTNAEKLYNRILAIRESKLGHEHQDTLKTIANLAINHGSQGRYVEAEMLFVQALSGREKLLGHDHPDTLWTLDDLANNHQYQGLYTEAENLYKRALAGRQKLLGHDHPDTLWTVDNLANNYQSQARYVEAEVLYRCALATNETQLGLDHPETLWTIDGLANVSYCQGQYGEAEMLYNRALEGRVTRLGQDHHNTLRTINGLANVYRSQGRHTEAEVLYNRVLAGREIQLGRDHPKTLTTVENLAMNYCAQGRYAEAERSYHRALMGRTMRLRHNHPDTLRAIESLASFYRSQGRSVEAETLTKERLG